MKVKICGVTDIETAKAICSYGADMIGFVFATSRRQVTVEQAKHIIAELPEHIEKIGVFVNEKPEKVQEIITACGLTMIQLHGEETEDYCNSFNIPVIKAFRTNTIEEVQQAFAYDVDYYLFDSPVEDYYGGNGTCFDWDVLQDIQSTKQIVLAGGLHCDNVQEAIRKVRPAVVDISSGVETNGKKDIEKIKAFIEYAKEEIR
jgi:phosphoribosylanthranilate isomerase